MKKTVLSLIMILLFLAACSKTTPDGSTTPSVPAPPSATKEVQSTESTEDASEDTKETASQDNGNFSYVHGPR